MRGWVWLEFPGSGRGCPVRWPCWLFAPWRAPRQQGTGRCLQEPSTLAAVSCAPLLPSGQPRPRWRANPPLSLLSSSSDAALCKATHTAKPEGTPHAGDPPLPATGGCGQGGCGSAAAYGFRSAKTSAGAERAESTSPLLRGFSSQWGGGGCLNPPVIPQPPGGLLASPPGAGQVWRGRRRKKRCW